MARSLMKSTAVVGSMTMLSRVLGFARDVLLARLFGADAGTDAFFVAFKIPNFLRRLFAEGAFSQAFVPVFSEYKEKRPDELRELAARVAGTLGGVLLLITLIAIPSAPLLIMLFGPGFVGDPYKYELAVDMLRVTFPYLFFISLTAFAGGMLNSYSRFAVPAFTPVLLNLALIGAALWLAPRVDIPVTALAWGVFIAGAAQLVFQLPFLARLGLLSWPKWGWRHDGVRRILRLMIPALFGSSVAQINLLLDTVIASLLVTGSISWLYYSDRLVELPLGVFGVALATVILPNLSRDHANTSTERFSATLDWALRWVLIIGTPATIGLLVLAGPMLTTLFYGGAFGAQDVRMAQLSLMAYSLGLLGFILVKVLAPGFYARQDTRTPVRIGIIAMVANMVMNVAFVVPLVMMDVQGTHAGLALATSTSAFINAGLLFRMLRRQGVYQPGPGWAAMLVRILAANAIMAALLVYGPASLETWMQWDTLSRAWRLAGWIALGGGVYFASLIVMGVPLRRLMRRATAEPSTEG